MSAVVAVPARRPRWPWFALAGFVAMAVGGSAVKLANGASIAEDGLFIVIFFGYGLVGALIASRVAGNRIGALLLYVSGLSAMSFVAGEGGNLRMDDGHRGAFEGWLLLLGESGWIFGLLPALLLLLQLFPDGRPMSGRWRWLTWGTFGLVALFGLGALGSRQLGEAPRVAENPVFVPVLAPMEGVFEVGFFAFIGLIALSVVALVVRYRRSEGAARQQIRWMAFAAVVVLLSFVLSVLLTELGWSDFATSIVSAVGIAAVPAAIGIAVLRYRLWDLDVVVRKTVLVVLVLVILLALFGVLTLVGTATTSFLFDDRADAVITLIIGLLVWPVYRVSRRLADRIVYGGRATPYEVLAGFADRVGATYTGDDVLVRMVTAVGEGIGAERADVWLDRDGTTALAATWPTTAPADGAVVADGERSTVFPVEFNGEPLGRLGARKGPGERMSGTDHKLIANLAAQAGPLLHNVSLTEALKTRLAELHAARRRLVAAQDEERRRLERNIHDGAQQQLVALAVKLRLADAAIDRDVAAAHDLLATLQQDATTALEDLRDLARGVYPPLLADRGLAVALDAQANRSAVPVHVRADGIGRFPVEIEAAVYFSCLEGLQNVAKYAEATHVDVALDRVNGHLEFQVRDDGRGFDVTATSYGTGLQGMADRLAALDGELEISSAPGEGTTIVGRVPVAAAGGGSEG
ncbi:MAG TPA: sensor histidine kinase [Actinomycetota bacterium]|nr:sensor histidine kinase [Actinomycetota bacterium]